MRGAVKMFQAHEQVDLVTVAADGTTTSTKVVFSTFLEERIPKLKAMRQQQVSWLEAPSED